MSGASGIVERLFLAVWEISWQASLLTLLVLAVQWLFRRQLNARWKSALWLVVLARLILPVVPENPWSVQQVLQTPQFVQRIEASPAFPHETFPAISAPVVSDSVPTISSGWNLSLLFSGIWLAGVMIGGSVMLWSNLRFIRMIRRVPEIKNSRLNIALAECCCQLGLSSPPRMAVTDRILVPAVMGFWKPVLLLPEDAALRYTDGELRHIFLHELAHLRRGDHQIQWLIALLHLLHWFNPVLALAFRRMRTDREPAADALALSCAGEDQRESYGLALLKVLETRPPRPSFPLAIGILEDKAHLASRFRLISSFTPKSYAWSLLGALLLGGLTVFGLSRPQGPATEAALSETLSGPALLPEGGILATYPFVREPLPDAQTGTLQIEARFRILSVSSGQLLDFDQKNKSKLPTAPFDLSMFDEALAVKAPPVLVPSEKKARVSIQCPQGEAVINFTPSIMKGGMIRVNSDYQWTDGRSPILSLQAELRFLNGQTIWFSLPPSRENSASRQIVIASLRMVKATKPEAAAISSSIELEAKVAELSFANMPEAEKHRIRSALDHGDIGPVLSSSNLDLVTCPAVVFKAGKQARIEIVRDFRFPSKYEMKEGQPPTPTEFDMVPVGVILDVTAVSDPTGILVSGNMVLREADIPVTDTEKFNLGVGFTTKEVRFNSLLEENKPRIAHRWSSEEGKKESFLILTAKKAAP